MAEHDHHIHDSVFADHGERAGHGVEHHRLDERHHAHGAIDVDHGVLDDPVVMKLVAAGAGVAATYVANKAIRAIWEAATGKPLPKNPNDASTRLMEAVAFAALSAAVAVLARRGAVHAAGKLLSASR